ncbi:MAG TPA: hypothetical protein VFV94_16410, partial [Polyangiaceae bacterium]|nr:hypothetical protein [Polyangiaceae bacterium]
MKIWTNWKLRNLVFGALSLASVAGCAADMGDEQGETAATTDEAIVVSSGAAQWKTGDGPRVPTTEVGIVDNGVQWILTGGGPSGSLAVHGASVRCVNK